MGCQNINIILVNKDGSQVKNSLEWDLLATLKPIGGLEVFSALLSGCRLLNTFNVSIFYSKKLKTPFQIFTLCQTDVLHDVIFYLIIRRSMKYLLI